MLRWSGELTCMYFTADVDIDYMPPRKNRIEPWRGTGIVREGTVDLFGRYITNHGEIIVVQVRVYESRDESEQLDIVVFSFVGTGRFDVEESDGKQ